MSALLDPLEEEDRSRLLTTVSQTFTPSSALTRVMPRSLKDISEDLLDNYINILSLELDAAMKVRSANTRRNYGLKIVEDDGSEFRGN